MIGFGAGFAHPLSGFDHLLAMVAVGLWGAQRGGNAVWLLPVAFPLIMVIGGILAFAGLYLPAAEVAIALSVLCLGSAIAVAWRPAEYVMLFPVAAFAVFHGWAHGIELPNTADPAAYAAGFVIATGLIHVAGVGLGLVMPRWVSRLTGAAIAAAGLYLIGAIYV